MKRKLYYINENEKLLKGSNRIVEGGLSRNIAMMNWLRIRNNDLCEIRLSNNPYINIIYVYYILISKKNSNILFQYVTVGVPLFNASFLGKIISRAFFKAVRISTKRNTIIFDISDLKYEQSKDMGLNSERLEQIKLVEKSLFSLEAYFIFASYEMQEYACKKYMIDSEKTEVLINGGHNRRNRNDAKIDNNLINFVYAGTLNKGRSIEEMINSFPDMEGLHLYLLGSNGEWIQKSCQTSNITYMGEFSEHEAQEFVSSCDIGLIPYDSSIRYFNIAFPTKLSFYITAGIPYLSTPVSEICRVKAKYDVGFVRNIKEWTSFISNIDKEVLESEKKKIARIKNDFDWDYIFSGSRLLQSKE